MNQELCFDKDLSFQILLWSIYRQEEHLIQTCCSYIRLGNNKLHERVPGSTYNVLVPVGSSTYTMSQGVIRHQHWFDSHRVPSILELCCQAGAIHPVEIHDNLQISDEDDRSISTLLNFNQSFKNRVFFFGDLSKKKSKKGKHELWSTMKNICFIDNEIQSKGWIQRISKNKRVECTDTIV